MNFRNGLSKKEYRITSSEAHNVLIRQKKFEALTENLFVKNKKCSNITQQVLNHGKKFEPIARKIYIDVMKFKLKHDVSVRETGIVILPLLYRLAASPDRLITHESSTLILGLIEIKCPFPNEISTHKICLKKIIFMSNYEKECHI